MICWVIEKCKIHLSFNPTILLLEIYVIYVFVCTTRHIYKDTHCTTETAIKDPDAGRDWGQEEKGTTEDEMPGWHH